MSVIVFQDKKLAIASGLRWSLLAQDSKKKQNRTEQIRARVRNSNGATRYVTTTSAEDAPYIGLYTPDRMGKAPKGDIHSIALVFLHALLKAHRGERSTINAALVMDVENAQSTKKAVVIILGGNIVHDTVEDQFRAHAIVEQNQNELGGFLQVLSSEGDIPGATHVSWEDLLVHATKESKTSPVPQGALLIPAVLGVLLLAGLGAAYHFLVIVPEQEAERRRKAQEADKTQQYLQQLAAAMQNAGWVSTSYINQLQAMRSDPYWIKGWSLAKLDCQHQSQSCQEHWVRHGGKLPELVAQRANGVYQPQANPRDSEASFSRKAVVEPAVLTHDVIPADDNEADMRLRPVINELVNAGMAVQLSAPTVWPSFPMAGVKQDVVIKRRKMTINADYYLAEQAVRQLPAHVIPDSISFKTMDPFTVQLTAYVYVK
jgi:hypothetical protein